MRKRDQTREGRRGNCVAACVATLFDWELSGLDSLRLEARGWEERLNQWLRSVRLSVIEVPYNRKSIHFPTSGYCIITGPNSRSRKSGADHAVVGQFTKRSIRIYHDPHPSREGIRRVDRVILFVERFV